MIPSLPDMLLEASKEGNLDKVKRLIQEGADVNHADNYGNTALIKASLHGHLEIVKELIQEGANVNHSNNQGNTALIWASNDGHLDITNLLIEAGANTNHTNNYGNTALILASFNGKLEIVKLLIQAGADYTSLKDKPGIKSIISDIVKEYSNDLKTTLVNNYLSLFKGTPQFNTGDKVKSAIPKSLLLKSVYEVPYQTLCSNINRDYPPLRLIALANLLKIDYDLDITWLDLCGKIKNVLYLML